MLGDGQSPKAGCSYMLCTIVRVL